MSGAAEAVTGIGLGDIVGEAFDVGSIVSDLGTEFLDVSSFTSFEIPSFDIPSFGGFDVAGSFAGDASWFNTFNPGSILDSIPGVSDFNLSSVTNTVTKLASNPVAVAAVSAATGVPPGLVTSAAGVATGALTSGSLPSLASLASNPAALAVAASTVGVPTNLLTSAAGVATGALTGGGLPNLASLASNPAALAVASSTVGVPTNLLTSAASVANNGIVGGAFRELSDAETNDLVKRNISPAFVNSFADTGTPPTNPDYNQAVETVSSTTSALKQYKADRDALTSDIIGTADNISAIQEKLDDPNITESERSVLESNLKTEYDTLAVTQQSLAQTDNAIEQVTAARNQASTVVENTTANTVNSAAAVGAAGAASRYQMFRDSSTNTWSVIDPETGEILASDLNETEAAAAAKQYNIANPGISGSPTAGAVSTPVTTGTVTATPLGGIQGTDVRGLVTQARDQQAIRNLRNNKAQSGDWRVRLRLGPNSNYLYNDGRPGILQPLKVTDGVIFPYTPAIETAYKANYDPYDLTHSNYRGYFYKNSYVDSLNLRATFTAQDTKEADYLLAVIHFFRSCTKMFYGKDAQRGSPPPLVYLSGYGDYQFNEHPCVVSQFNYTLPPDVDYVRCQSTLTNNTNQLNSRLRNPIANNPLAYSVNRLLNSSLFQGALNNSPVSQANNLDSAGPTYVPTKMEISVSLLPIQSRAQVSNNFSVKEFANGNLLKGGFW